MKTWVIIRKSDLEILGSYQAEQKNESNTERSHLLSAPLATHIELPEGLDLEIAECLGDGEEIWLEIDEVKEAAREVRRWNELRNERDNRLAATDKYLLSDFPISSQDRNAVKAYRQALRDLPEELEHPQDVQWPEFPL